MSSRQLEHHEVVNTQKRFPVAIVCDNLSIAENVGMAFRLAEAMGVSNICLCGSTPAPPNKKLEKVARSTVNHVGFQVYANTLDCIQELAKDGFSIYCLEITTISQPIQKVDFKQSNKIAIVIGAESHGVQDEVLKHVDKHIHIPMYGKNSSMNVIQSLSMALYEITNQINRG